MYTHNRSLWKKPVRSNLTASEKLVKSLSSFSTTGAICKKCGIEIPNKEDGLCYDCGRNKFGD
jgi:hypothetical protein